MAAKKMIDDADIRFNKDRRIYSGDECLWIRDIDNCFSETGVKIIEEIRKICTCPECTMLRSKEIEAK